MSLAVISNLFPARSPISRALSTKPRKFKLKFFSAGVLISYCSGMVKYYLVTACLSLSPAIPNPDTGILLLLER